MLIVEILHSRLDGNGNSYHAICVENKRNGKSATATVAANNVASALRVLFGDWEAKRFHSHEYETRLSIREFNATTKGEPHAGCTPEEIAAWIVANVGPVEGAKL